MTQETATELELTEVKPEQLFVQDGLDSVLSKIETEARSIVIDISTAQGRKNCASVAYSVAKAKTTLDAMGKDFVSDLKKQAAKVDERRRIIRERLDELKDEIRRPLTEWEQEQERINREIEERINTIKGIAAELAFGGVSASADIKIHLDKLANVEILPEHYGLRIDEAKAAKDAELLKLEGMYFRAKHNEEEAAKIEAERKAKEEADRKARDEAEAKARAERDEKIRRDAEEKAKREAEESRQKEIRARQEAEERAKAAEERAKQQIAEAKARADRESAEKEARRIAEEARKKQEEDRKASNAKHRAKIEKQAVESLSEIIDYATAEIVIEAIKSNKVTNIQIQYL